MSTPTPGPPVLSELRIQAAANPYSSFLPRLMPGIGDALNQIADIAATAFPLWTLDASWSPGSTFEIRATVAPRTDDLDVIDGLREWAHRLDGWLYLYPQEETRAGTGIFHRHLTANAWIGDVQVTVTGSIAWETGAPKGGAS